MFNRIEVASNLLESQIEGVNGFWQDESIDDEIRDGLNACKELCEEIERGQSLDYLLDEDGFHEEPPMRGIGVYDALYEEGSPGSLRPKPLRRASPKGIDVYDYMEEEDYIGAMQLVLDCM